MISAIQAKVAMENNVFLTLAFLMSLKYLTKLLKRCSKEKEFVTMKLTHDGYYEYIEAMDYRFYLVSFLFQSNFSLSSVIQWLYSENFISLTNELVDIEKYGDKVIFYDSLLRSSCCQQAWSLKSLIMSGIRFLIQLVIEDVPENKLEMSKENFEELVTFWHELRITKPAIILLVIHEDNYVTLETDRKLIEAYQNAGYAFKYDPHIR